LYLFYMLYLTIFTIYEIIQYMPKILTPEQREKNKLASKKRYENSKAGKEARKKAQDKANKKRLENKDTLRIDNATNTRLKAVQGKNDDERLNLLIDIHDQLLLTKLD